VQNLAGRMNSAGSAIRYRQRHGLVGGNVIRLMYLELDITMSSGTWWRMALSMTLLIP
jgi:hypothetical protein